MKKVVKKKVPAAKLKSLKRNLTKHEKGETKKHEAGESKKKEASERYEG